ncbi:MAG: RluA family pseudouridine synthase [Candidatus Omnitrophota bacterium]
MYELIVTLDDNGKRIDNVVTKNIANTRPELAISRSVIQRLIESGDVHLNKKEVKSSHKVKPDDLIEIDEEKLEEESLLEEEGKTPRAEDLPLNIIYEDDDIIVVNKPAGMVVHPACGNYSGTLVNALLNYKGFLTDFNKPRKTEDERHVLRPGIVHRLDKDTSGVMIVAKNGPALRKLSKQLKERSMTKKYLAVCRGIIEFDEGIINAPLSHDKKDRRRMAVDIEEGKEAITYFKVLKRDKKKNITIVEARPKTGRTHQIRIHFLHLGYPILGDKMYSTFPSQGLEHHALHARSIEFIHPTKGKKMEFEAELPEELNNIIKYIC